MILGILMLIEGLAFGGLMWYLKFRQGADTLPPTNSPPRSTFNYHFPSPPKGWEKNSALQSAIQAKAFALRRKDPDAFMCLDAQDYKTVNPDVGILVEEIEKRLAVYFENLAWTPSEEAKLGGKKAYRMQFFGEKNKTPMTGECHVLAYKGIGYWLTTWTTVESYKKAENQILEEFELLRMGFALDQDRENWEEKRTVLRLKGKKAGYELDDVPGPWKVALKVPDRQADNYLESDEPEDTRNEGSPAIVAVLLLPKAADLKTAATEARNHVEQQRKTSFPNSTMTVLTDNQKAPLEVDGPIGDVSGRIVKLRAHDSAIRERFLILGVVFDKDSNQTLVIQCECDWRRRTRWEPVFGQILNCLRMKKTEK